MSTEIGAIITERNDVIAAVATPRGTGGIAVIRISGEGALGTALKVFSPASKKPVRPRFATYGKIAKDGKTVDTGILVYYKSPASYTGEDMCELSCHGGALVTEKVLKTALSAGARLAEPGEFTKRRRRDNRGRQRKVPRGGGGEPRKRRRQAAFGRESDY